MSAVTGSKKGSNKLGVVYRCSVCGAEVSVVKDSEGHLSPVCCDVPMEVTGRVSVVYHCPRCGSEVMVVMGEPRNLEPHCCDTKMLLVNT